MLPLKIEEIREMTQPKKEDVITVKVGGKSYQTVIDDEGTQRFLVNKLFRHLHGSCRIDLNQLVIDYSNGLFTQEEYLHFCMGIGYSVSGLSRLPQFENLEFENPL